MRRFSARPGPKSKRNREGLDREEPAEPPGLLPRIGAAHPGRQRDPDGSVRAGEPGVRKRADTARITLPISPKIETGRLGASKSALNPHTRLPSAARPRSPRSPAPPGI